MTIQEHVNYLINNEYIEAVELVTTKEYEKYITVHFAHKAGAILYCEFFGIEDSIKIKLMNLMQPNGAVYVTLNFSELFKVYNDKGYEVEGINIDKTTLEITNTKQYKWIHSKEIRCTHSDHTMAQYVIVNNIWYNIPAELSNYVQAAVGVNCKRYIVIRKEAIKRLAGIVEEYCNVT